jgi:hypothetical protein
MEFNMNIFILYHSNLSTNPYFCTSKVHCEKWVYFYFKNNYIDIFIIKLLMYNQFQILNLINFICYRCPKKGNCAKIGTMTQKVSHLSVHSPFHVRLSYSWKKVNFYTNAHKFSHIILSLESKTKSLFLWILHV